MKREMAKYELPEPEFYEERGSFKVIFRNGIKFELDSISEQVSGQQNGDFGRYKLMILDFCSEPRTAKEISNYIKVKSRQYISSNFIKPLIDEGKLEYTNKKSNNYSEEELDNFKNKKLGIYRWYKNLNIFISNVDKIKSVK